MFPPAPPNITCEMQIGPLPPEDTAPSSARKKVLAGDDLSLLSITAIRICNYKRHSVVPNHFCPPTLLFYEKYMSFISEGVQFVGLCDYHYYQMTMRESNFEYTPEAVQNVACFTYLR